MNDGVLENLHRAASDQSLTDYQFRLLSLIYERLSPDEPARLPAAPMAGLLGSRRESVARALDGLCNIGWLTRGPRLNRACSYLLGPKWHKAPDEGAKISESDAVIKHVLADFPLGAIRDLNHSQVAAVAGVSRSTVLNRIDRLIRLEVLEPHGRHGRHQRYRRLKKQNPERQG